MNRKVYKAAFIPPDGPQFVIDGRAPERGGSFLEQLEDRLERAKKRLARLQAQIKDSETKLREIEAKAETHAKKEAEKYLNRAREEAEREKQRIIAEARSEAERKGRDEGFRKGTEEAKNLLLQVQRILKEAHAERRRIIASAESDLVELSIQIAEKIIKTEVRENHEIILGNVREALKKVTGKEVITLRVNLDDLDITSEHRDEFLRQIRGLKEINFVPDSSIERGGVRIDTDFGSVDARVDSQIEEIRERFRSQLHGRE